MLQTGAFDEHVEFFLARIDAYHYIAQAPTSVKPNLVSGQHMSVRLRFGWRLWGFQSEIERDTFIVQYGGRSFPE